MNNLPNEWLISRQSRINKFIKKKFDKKDLSTTICKASNYALLNGGKRFRALLVYAIGAIDDTDKNQLDFIAASIEIIHAYSLIHDDLPDMDNDSLRRGLPSCHIKYGVAQAILAGDALQSLAFEILSSEDFKISDQQKINLIAQLSKAIGVEGMVLGQSLDMESSNKKIDEKLLKKIQKNKTGQLIYASCTMPFSISKNFDISVNNLISRFSLLLGQLYQIVDDILDNSSTSERLGKTSGKDQDAKKATYVSIVGIDETIKIKDNLYLSLKENLSSIPGNTKILSHLTDRIYSREY